MRLASLLAAAFLASAIPAVAHFPQTPNLRCTPQQLIHDWVAGSAAVTVDDSIDCPGVPICEEDVVVIFPIPGSDGIKDYDQDLDGDGVNEGDEDADGDGVTDRNEDTDGDGTRDGLEDDDEDGIANEDEDEFTPSDPITVPCDPPLDTPLIPGSDGDFEWGIGAAFLPDDHHTGDAGIVTVTCDGVSCAWNAGRDGDDDGIIDGAYDPTDCLSDPISGGATVLLTDADDGRVCDVAGAAGSLDRATWVYVTSGIVGVVFPGPIVDIHYDPDQDGDPQDTTVNAYPENAGVSVGGHAR